MKRKTPPALATWLLKHFGCSPNNESVIGDLVEQRRQGKSYFWYWRQVLTAISSSSVSQAKDHPGPISRGIVAGWIVQIVWMLSSSVVLRESSYPNFNVGTKLEILLVVAILLVALCARAATGWVVSQVSGEYRRAAVLGFVSTTFLYIVVQFGLQSYQSWQSSGIPLNSLLRDIVVLGCFAGLSWIAILIAILFGGGLLTAPPRRLHFELRRHQ